MTTRRQLLIAGASSISLACSGTAHAQAPTTVRRIGLLTPYSPSDVALWHQALRLGLRDLGWVESKNISIEYRYAEGRIDRLPELVADLVRLKVDVIVASVNVDAVAAKTASKTIPIIVAAATDPVATGMVESLARPGGNVTGLSQMTIELSGKRLELLKEMVPKLSRVAVLWNPQGALSQLTWKELQLPARQLGVQLHSLEVRNSSGYDKAFEDVARARTGVLYLIQAPVIVTNLRRISDFAVRNRLPSIFQWSEFADSGGLVAYGPDRADMFRRAATFVDKILKGAKPSDLPVEQPTKFELVINMKTAKALGLTIPPAVLVRANRVIE